MMQALLNGLIGGLLIALPAIALSLTYGVLNFANFSIGALITAGAYFAYFYNVNLGLHVLVAVALAGLSLSIVAIIIERLVYRPLGNADHITLLVGSMGVAFVIENLIRLIYGADVRTLDIEVARLIIWNDLRLNKEQLIIVLVSIGAFAAVALTLKWTSLGRAMRAVSDNPALAEVRGVNRRGIVNWTWAISGTLAAIAGALVAMDATVEPLIGTNYLISVFAATIVGGIGSPLGAVVGGVLIGIVEELSTLALPTTYRQGVSFFILVLMLFTRPHGIFGQAKIKR